LRNVGTIHVTVCVSACQKIRTVAVPRPVTGNSLPLLSVTVGAKLLLSHFAVYKLFCPNIGKHIYIYTHTYTQAVYSVQIIRMLLRITSEFLMMHFLGPHFAYQLLFAILKINDCLTV
jgi:hypothetical protein